MRSIVILLSLFLATSSTYTTWEKIMRLEDKTKLFYSVSKPLTKTNDQYTLLLVLHWGWDRNREIPDYYGEDFMLQMIMPALEKTDYRPLLVAPDCPDISWTTQKSQEALKQLINKMEHKYGIDTTSIVIAGFSAGGIGSWCFAGKNPDLVNVCIPMASQPDHSWISDWNIENTYVIQGEKDELFSHETVSAVIEKMGGESDSLEMIIVEGATHYDGSLYIDPLSKVFIDIAKK